MKRKNIKPVKVKALSFNELLEEGPVTVASLPEPEVDLSEPVEELDDNQQFPQDVKVEPR